MATHQTKKLPSTAGAETPRHVVVHHQLFEERPPGAPIKTCNDAKNLLVDYFACSWRDLPILTWFPKLSRATLLQDAIAGISVSVLLIPQSMAYASLAGLPPVYGLYVSTLPLFIYALLGSSSQLAVGPVGPVAILVSRAVAQSSDADDPVAAAAALGLVSGLILIVLGCFRFGFVANLLSWPVMSGFTSAAAFIIVISQLTKLFGEPSIPSSINSFYGQVGHVFGNLPKLNGWTTLLGVLSLASLLASKHVSFRGKKLPRWFPFQLILVILTTAISAGADLSNRASIKVVGSIATGFPSPSFPIHSFSHFLNLIPSAFTLALVAYVSAISLAVIFGKEKGEEVMPNLELVALGTACTVGSLFGGFTISGSFTRTAVNAELKAMTPTSGIFQGSMMVAVVLALASLFESLPQAVLGAMVIASCKSLVKLEDAKRFWKLSKRDFFEMLVTFFLTLTFGVADGILYSVGVSLVLLMYRSFQPRIVELGRFPGTDVFVDHERFPQTKPVAGVKILRVDGELHFGNIGLLVRRLQDLIHKIKRTREVCGYQANQTRARSVSYTGSDRDSTGTNQQYQNISGSMSEANFPQNVSMKTINDTQNGHAKLRGRRYADDGSSTPLLGASDDVEANHDMSQKDDALNELANLHGIVIDGGRVTNVDAHACRDLIDALQTIRKSSTDIKISLAAFIGPARDKLWQLGVVDVVGTDNMHLTVAAAVHSILGTMHFTKWQRSIREYARTVENLFSAEPSNGPSGFSLTSHRESRGGSLNPAQDDWLDESFVYGAPSDYDLRYFRRSSLADPTMTDNAQSAFIEAQIASTNQNTSSNRSLTGVELPSVQERHENSVNQQ